jgi:hypothetical protein
MDPIGDENTPREVSRTTDLMPFLEKTKLRLKLDSSIPLHMESTNNHSLQTHSLLCLFNKPTTENNLSSRMTSLFFYLLVR